MMDVSQRFMFLIVPSFLVLRAASYHPRHVQPRVHSIHVRHPDPRRSPKALSVVRQTVCQAGLVAIEPLSALAEVNTFFEEYPYISAFSIAGLKGCVADGIAQSSERDDAGKRRSFSWPRNLAFLMYAGGYSGCMQHFIFNEMFPSMFGIGSDLKTVVSKVFFELFILTPFLTLPLVYLIKALMFKGPALKHLRESLTKYAVDVVKHGILNKYWMVWGPVMSLAFSVVPEHLRIAFIAAVSFFWTILLSSFVNRDANSKFKKQEVEPDEQSKAKSSAIGIKKPLLSFTHAGGVQRSSGYPSQTPRKSVEHWKPSPVYSAQTATIRGVVRRLHERGPVNSAQPARKSGLSRRLHEQGPGHTRVQSLEIWSSLNRYSTEIMKKLFVKNKLGGLNLSTDLFVYMASFLAYESINNLSTYAPNCLINF